MSPSERLPPPGMRQILRDWTAHEAEDLAKAFQTLAASDDPHDVWFREHLVSVHGLTAEMLSGPIPATMFFDYRADG